MFRFIYVPNGNFVFMLSSPCSTDGGSQESERVWRRFYLPWRGRPEKNIGVYRPDFSLFRQFSLKTRERHDGVHQTGNRARMARDLVGFYGESYAIGGLASSHGWSRSASVSFQASMSRCWRFMPWIS